MAGRPKEEIYLVLEHFRHQFFQWVYINGFDLVQTTELFKQLFDKMSHASGLGLQVEYDQWVTRKRKWDNDWKTKDGAFSSRVIQELSELPLWYEGTKPVMDLQPKNTLYTPPPLALRYSQARRQALEGNANAGGPRRARGKAILLENPHQTDGLSSASTPVRPVRTLIPKTWGSGAIAEGPLTGFPQQASPSDSFLNFPGRHNPYGEYPEPERLISPSLPSFPSSYFRTCQYAPPPHHGLSSNTIPSEHISPGTAGRDADVEPVVLCTRKRTQTGSFPTPPAARRKGQTPQMPAADDGSLRDVKDD